MKLELTRVTAIFAVLLACLLLSVPAIAQQGVAVDQVHAGSTLAALTEVPIRDSLPGGGALYVKGGQTGTLKPGEIITVTKEGSVSTILGTQKWVYFSLPGKSSGWVLVGNLGTTSPRFGKR